MDIVSRSRPQGVLETNRYSLLFSDKPRNCISHSLRLFRPRKPNLRTSTRNGNTYTRYPWHPIYLANRSSINLAAKATLTLQNDFRLKKINEAFTKKNRMVQSSWKLDWDNSKNALSVPNFEPSDKLRNKLRIGCKDFRSTLKWYVNDILEGSADKCVPRYCVPVMSGENTHLAA